MKKNKIGIIGGGAAGLFAAIIAAENKNNEVFILEKNDRVGKKLLATGNGRCNYTNINAGIDNYHGENNKFSLSALNNFNVQRTIGFFEKLGIMPKIEDEGKVYPMSEQASSILDVLRMELEFLDVKVLTETNVEKIISKQGTFLLRCSARQDMIFDKLIITTGGKAMPVSGSDGKSFSLIEDLGHTVSRLFPGIVQLKLKEDFCKQIQGVKKDAKVSLMVDNKVKKEDYGEVLFTNYGVSGPPILQVSRTANYYLNNNKRAFLEIDFYPEKRQEELSKYLFSRAQNSQQKNTEEYLIGFINKRLIAIILKEAALDKNLLATDLSKKDIDSLVRILKSWKLEIIGSKSWQTAQVTAGGVRTKEVNPNTLESKIIPGIHFAGEVLDIDGDCGGFNLQWAWSSAYLAASSL